MESYKDKTDKERYHHYQEHGMQGLQGLSKGEIITILSEYCIGDEAIIPEIKKQGWTIEQYIQARQEIGSRQENIALRVGAYIALDQCPKNISDNREQRQRLTENYTHEQLFALGKSYKKEVH